MQIEETLVDLIKQVTRLTAQVEMMAKIGWILMGAVITQIVTNFSIVYKNKSIRRKTENEEETK